MINYAALHRGGNALSIALRPYVRPSRATDFLEIEKP